MSKLAGKFKKFTKIFLLGGFLWFLFKREKKSKDICLKDLEYNFYDFLKEEKREIGELVNNKENIDEYIEDSSSIFKDYFVPHRGNGHHPKILRKKQLLIVLILAVLMKASLVTYLFFLYPNNGKMSEDIQRDVYVLLNKERESAGLKPLLLNHSLYYSAEAKALDMISNNYFAHEGLDGKMPWDWVSRKDYPYLYIGENLGMNFASAESVHRALMNSPSHKKNIMNEKYTDIGLIVTRGNLNGKETNILVQIFGAEKKPEPAESEIVVMAPLEKNESLVEKEEIPKKDDKTEVASSEITFEEETKEQKSAVAEIETEKKIIALREKIEKDLDIEEENIIMDDSSLDSSKGDVEESVSSSSSLMLGDLAKTNTENDVIEVDDFMIANLDREMSYVASIDNNDKYMIATRISDYINYFILGLLVLMSLFLMVNIFVRFEVQHKPVIVQTLLLIILLFGIYSTHFHFLEKIPNYIALY